MNTPIDSLRAEVRALRAAFKEIREALVLFGWTITAKSSAMGDDDAAQTADDDRNRGQRPVRRIEPFGFRFRAPSKLRALWLRLGSSNVAFIGIAPSKGYGPSDLDDGEVAVYNITKALIRLWKTGKITLDSDNADIVLNGGTKKMARVTDPLAVGTIAGTAGPWPVNFTYVPTQDDGGVDGPGAPSVGPSVTLAGIVSNSGGADKVKG